MASASAGTGAGSQGTGGAGSQGKGKGKAGEAVAVRASGARHESQRVCGRKDREGVRRVGERGVEP